MSIYDEIRAERERAHAKHGATSMEGNVPPEDPTGRRYRILVEEVGEVAEEWNDAEHDGRPVDMARVRKELIQVAAMAAAWADAIPAGVADQPEPTEPTCERIEDHLAHSIPMTMKCPGVGEQVCSPDEYKHVGPWNHISGSDSLDKCAACGTVIGK